MILHTIIIQENESSSWSFSKSKFFTLIKLINSYSSKINNFRTSISIFLLLCAFPAVIGIRYSRSIAYDTSIVIGSIVAFITYSNEGCGSYIGVADYASVFALFAESADRYSPLFAAHDQIWMMFCHSFSYNL